MAPTAPGPVFVGGSGRSGSTVMGRLIGSHPRFAYVRTEIRFHAERFGVPDLLAGRVKLDAFLARMRGYYFRHEVPAGRPRAGLPRGLYKIASEDDVLRALDHFGDRFADEPRDAARALVEELLGPTMRAAGKPSFVETTPDNAVAAATLAELFPDCRIVHSLRDGRDVAASLVGRGLPTMEQALDRWATKLHRVQRASRNVGPEQLLSFSLYDLVHPDRRDAAYERLLNFLGVPDADEMRAFFEQEMRPDQAHVGRWREETPEERQEAIDAHYERLLARLARSGFDVTPLAADAGVSG